MGAVLAIVGGGVSSGYAAKFAGLGVAAVAGPFLVAVNLRVHRLTGLRRYLQL